MSFSFLNHLDFSLWRLYEGFGVCESVFVIVQRSNKVCLSTYLTTILG